MSKRNSARKKTPRDAQMSKLMKHQVLSIASKQLSRKKMASGLYLEPYRKGK